MKIYETPDFEITEFAAEDVITLSITVGSGDEENTTPA